MATTRTNITTQTYSSKSTAIRGADRAFLEPSEYSVKKSEDGKWRVILRAGAIAEHENIEAPETATAVELGENAAVNAAIVAATSPEEIEEIIDRAIAQEEKEHYETLENAGCVSESEIAELIVAQEAKEEAFEEDAIPPRPLTEREKEASSEEEFEQNQMPIIGDPHCPVAKEDEGGQVWRDEEIAAQVDRVETAATISEVDAALALIRGSRPAIDLDEAPSPKAKTRRTVKAEDTIQDPDRQESPLVALARKVFNLDRPRQKHFDAIEAAQRGEMPVPPKFDQPSYQPHKKCFDKLQEVIDAGDADAIGLAALAVNSGWTIRKRIKEYGLLSAMALKARERQAAAQ